MKKLLIFAAVLTGVGVLTRRLVARCENVDWEKKIEALPDNAPPKWMFRNITTIRDNTEHILQLLESGSADRDPAKDATESVTV